MQASLWMRCVTTLKDLPENKRNQMRNTWIGDGFHIPCLVLVFWAHVAEAAPLLRSLQSLSEQRLQSRSPGSPSDKAALAAILGKLTQDQFVQEVSVLFADFAVCAKAMA